MKTTRFIIFIHLLSIGCVCEAVKSRRKKNTSHKYRDMYFLTDEGQSCADISDKRKKERTVQFCSVPAPKPDMSTTLTFWGWQKRNGERKKYVQVYGSSEATSNETFLFEMKIRNPRPTAYGVISDDSRSEWYHQEFILNSSIANEVNISYLQLYYFVNAGENEELNLRDVWIRPTDKYSNNKPSRSCNLGLQKTAIVFFWIACVMIPIIRICMESNHEDIQNFCGICGFGVSLLFALCIFVLIYVAPYPMGKRCKKDEDFILIMVVGSILAIPCSLCCCGIIFVITMALKPMIVLCYHKCCNCHGLGRGHISRWFRRSKRVVVVNNDNVNDENVIKIATQNTKENKFPDRSFMLLNGNECSNCMGTYTMVRPGVVTECGHVWCSKCIENICRMRPPDYSGICPMCFSPVELQNLILIDLPKEGDV